MSDGGISEPVLSVVVPCFNEAPTVKEILDRVLDSPLVGEVIAIDDASTDTTLQILQSYGDPRLRVLAQSTNQGKGAALRRGFAAATMPFVIVQDADLEYDPSEYPRILAPLLADEADVVYGSRFIGGDARRILYFWHMVGNKLLTLASNMATNLNLSDMETCYKAFRREIIQQITIDEDRFGFEPEVTAKVAAMRCRVYEVGISYHGRTYDDGKKIGWRDGIRALYCIVAYSPPGMRLGVRRAGPAVARLTG
jgi:glycosyltransferase involved in cell wall biosynthesis